MMTVRSAKETDIPRIGELLLQVCRVHHEGRPDLFKEVGRKYDDGQLREILRDPEHVVLAADDGGGLVGYAFCEYQRHSGEGAMRAGTTLYLDDLCVDEKRRGAGIGKTLYEAVVRHARETGCHNVTLNVWACNESAMRFYEKMGLQVQKTGMEIVLE